MKLDKQRTNIRFPRSAGAVLALALAVGVQAAAQEALYGFDPETRIYIVQPGDTLWDISGKAYTDPWKWPRIWENNPEVENPHLILPDQQLVLPYVEGGAAPVAAAKPVALANPAIEPSPKAGLEPASEPVTEAVEPVEPAPVAEPAATPEPVSAVEPEVSGAEILQDASDVAQTSRLAEVPVRIETPQRARAIVVRFGDEGIYREKAPDESVYLLGGEERRSIFGRDDVVYVTGGRKAGMKPGQRFYVYDRGERIEHPDTDEDLGVFLRTVGVIEIEEVSEDAARARVKVSFDAIESDMHLAPWRPMQKEIVPRTVPARIEGRILHAADGQTTVGAWQVVYVDRGLRDGIENGAMLRIERELKPRRRSRKEPYHHLPPKELGLGVVIDAGERASTVLIVRSLSEIEAGDRIVTVNES